MKLQEVRRRGKDKIKTFFGHAQKMFPRKKKMWMIAVGVPIFAVVWIWGIAPILPVKDPFGHSAKVCRIDAYGASKEDPAQTRSAFVRAFADCAPGGTVVVPWGTWKTGGIIVPSDVTLYFSLGSTLSFSDDPNLYLPAVPTRWEGMDVMNYQPFIYIPNAQNVAILGHGKVYGNGEKWWEWKQKKGADGERSSAKQLYEMAKNDTPLDRRHFGSENNSLRPSMVQTYESDTVVIDGPSFFDGPMWTIHFVYSKNIIVRNVTVNSTGPNTDGIAFDSSESGLVSGCTVGSGDDAIVIKSGLDYDGWKQNRPSKHIVIESSRIVRGNGGVTIGSEMSGGVEDVVVRDMRFSNVDTGIRLKTLKGRGGYIRDIHYENIRMRGIVEYAVQLDMRYKFATLISDGDQLPRVENIFLKNIFSTKTGTALRVLGTEDSPIRDFSVKESSFFGDASGTMENITNVLFDNVFLTSADKKPLEARNIENGLFSGYFPRGGRGDVHTNFKGSGTKNIHIGLFPCLHSRCVTQEKAILPGTLLFN